MVAHYEPPHLGLRLFANSAVSSHVLEESDIRIHVCYQCNYY